MIDTEPGQTYHVSLDIASRQGKPVAGQFAFGAENHLLATSNKSFVTVAWPAMATSNKTLVQISGYTNSGLGQLLIDNVSVTKNSKP